MASKITFTSAELQEFGRNQKGGWAVFSSSMTKDIMSKMGWAEMPDCLLKGGLEGELSAINIDLVPNDRQLRNAACNILINRVSRFQAVRLELEGSKGKGHRTELRFEVAVSDPAGCQKLEAYMLTAGKSSLSVSYEKQAVQEEIPEVRATEDQRQAVMEIN